MNFSVKNEKKSLVIMFGDQKLARVSRKVLKNLLASFPEDEEEEEVSTVDLEKTALRLMQVYCKEKGKFYGGRTIRQIKPSDRKNFSFFIKAAEIVITQRVTLREFIAAQVQGLQFVNDGEGQFPRINQLATPEAENRVLDFMRQGKMDNDPEQDVTLSREDRVTPLTDNKKYRLGKKKLRAGTASLKELRFLAKCEQHHKGMVHPEITSAIKYLKEVGDD